MLQPAFHVGGGALAARTPVRRLPLLLNTVRLQKVYLNAQDVYSLAGSIAAGDHLKLMGDPDFIRGLKGCFDRSDQSVLSPFQVNVVNDLFNRAGLRVMPKDIALPDEEQASPESLINALLAMIATKNRDDRKITKIANMMKTMIPDFVPTQLVNAVKALSMLKCTDYAVLSQFGKRAAESHEDLSHLELATIVHSLCLTPGITHGVYLKLFQVVSMRCEDFRPEDTALILQGMIAVGPRYKQFLAPLVLQCLENVETLNGEVLGYFLGAITVMQYQDRGHTEIIADAMVERCHELSDRQVTMTLESMAELGVLSPQLFDDFAERVLPRIVKFDVRNVAGLIDVCSRLAPGSTKVDAVMMALLDRCADAAILFSHNMLGDILDGIALYPPAKTHPATTALGKQVRRRMEGMGPPPLAKAVNGLASLGYADADIYVEAALVQLRWGFKDYSILEPILMGLVTCGVQDPVLTKLLASHIPPMAKQMTLVQVERCNTYLNRLQSDDERAYRALADRVKVFVKEVTPDVPAEIQTLLERAAASQAEYEAKQEARRAARAQRPSYGSR